MTLVYKATSQESRHQVIGLRSTLSYDIEFVACNYSYN